MSRLNATRPGAAYMAHSTRGHLVTNDEFPLLDFRELSQCLQECDFAASEELVARPSGSYIRKLFEQILDTFIGLSPDYCGGTARDLLQTPGPAGGADSGGADADDTADAVHVLVFFRAVNMFLQKCGILDFTLLDLVRPDPLRTQRVLSGVINFARFREEHLRECELLAKEAEEAMQEVRNLDDERVDLANRIDKLRRRLKEGDAAGAAAGGSAAAQKSLLAQLLKYNSKLEQELIKLQKSQEVFKKEHASYRETKARLIEKLEDQHFLLSESERELLKIEAYASADPAVVRQVVADLRLHSQAAEEELKKSETTVRNKTRTQQAVQTVEDELRNLIKIVQEISNDMKVLDAAKDNYARQNDELSSKQQISDELTVHLERAKRQFQKSEEKIAKLRQQALEKEQAAHEKFLALEMEYDMLTQDRDAKQEKLDRTKKENSQIEADIRKMKLDFDFEFRNTTSAVAKLNAHIRQYLEDISRHL
ncbi:Nuf2-domain-containing protein [Metschnikowia bicuspidata var. bicuspidata NRRL YB-4993]|uniref:Nuf2-domain-containing protein n=1 Tax=Metschnikowia bicuspidata var. bicuspidata NRRL YB-4993 TaxID=869754 RepID=A0A1A0H2A5_9ASCO|nr:Nuf2-domain-containing protein [Metschnikowia bicuspidata var. bicuspidata NRRL YB-4993]OBA18057.1 Nuf2-domain-containing protein [Metschnikowia bicuspidata var. bicuspidata NRRL YB-4993]